MSEGVDFIASRGQGPESPVRVTGKGSTGPGLSLREQIVAALAETGAVRVHVLPALVTAAPKGAAQLPVTDAQLARATAPVVQVPSDLTGSQGRTTTLALPTVEPTAECSTSPGQGTHGRVGSALDAPGAGAKPANGPLNSPALRRPAR